MDLRQGGRQADGRKVAHLTEDQFEQETLGWLAEVGWQHRFGPELAPEGSTPERESYRRVVLVSRLRQAVAALNPGVPAAARDDAIRQVLDLGTPALMAANRHFHRLLVTGVPMQYQRDGETRGDFVQGHGRGDEPRDLRPPLRRDRSTPRARAADGRPSTRTKPSACSPKTQVMEELVQMAKKFREAASRGEKLGLNEDEVRFYDALAENESAVRELSDETLKKIAHELAENLRKNLTVDWSARESVQARLRLMVKRILRKYKYPPDLQDAAVELVLKQARALGEAWA